MGTFAIQFWNVTCPGKEPIENLLLALIKKSAADRIRTMSDGFVTVRDAKKDGEIWVGDMLRIQTKQLPAKANSMGATEALGLAENEGLGTSNAFLYHPPTKTLLFESNRGGISASRAVDYMLRENQVTGKHSLKPILRGDAIKEFRKVAAATKVEITFADIDGASLFSDSDNEFFGAAVRFHNLYSPPLMTISLSMGHKPGALDKSLKKDIVALLTGVMKGAGAIKKCQAHVREDLDSETTVLDLLTNKIIDEGVVESNERNQAAYSLRIAELKSAWQRRGEEVLKVSPKQKGKKNE